MGSILAIVPADWCLATGGACEPELEILDCTPVASDPQMHALLWGDGIRDTVGLYVEPVVFLPGDQFEFGAARA